MDTYTKKACAKHAFLLGVNLPRYSSPTITGIENLTTLR